MPTWSGLWNGQFGQAYSALPNGNTTDYNNRQRDKLAALFKGEQGRRLGAIIRALTGSAVGQLAQSSVTKVPAISQPGQAYSGGGYIRAVVDYDINRNTVAADETYVDGITLMKNYPTYPVDKSGNGGPKSPGVF